MKKLIVFVLIVFLLCGLNLSSIKNMTLEKVFPNSCVEVYTSKRTESLLFNKIDNGLGEVIFCKIDDLNYILNLLKFVEGFTIKFSKNTMSKSELIDVLCVQNGFVENYGFFGWSRTLCELLNNKFFIKLQKNKCNFQLFEQKNSILLGIPIILGGC